jgi:hypothetical protein
MSENQLPLVLLEFIELRFPELNPYQQIEKILEELQELLKSINDYEDQSNLTFSIDDLVFEGLDLMQSVFTLLLQYGSHELIIAIQQDWKNKMKKYLKEPEIVIEVRGGLNE